MKLSTSVLTGKKFLRINLWFFPVALCSVIGRYHIFFFSAFVFAAIHELSHVICAKVLNVKVSHITIFPFGITAHLQDGYIKKSDKEFIIAFAGPFSNLVLFWIFSSLQLMYKNDFIQFCADVNLAMCSINLFPILPLDGGRMLKSILTPKYGAIRVYRFTIKLSRIFLVFLMFLALCLLLITDFNFSLILISAFLFQNLSREQQCLSHNTAKEIIENSAKLTKTAIFPTKTFTVKEHTPASHILRVISHDYFCVFLVTNKKTNIVKTLTETEILNALTQKGIRLKFGEI